MDMVGYLGEERGKKRKERIREGWLIERKERGDDNLDKEATGSHKGINSSSTGG
jgi:hypothetical protein